MKINRKPDGMIPVRKIQEGSVFMEYDSYYIKTNFLQVEADTEDEMVIAVNIETGTVEWFYLSDRVYPVEVECILKENEEVDG